MDELKALQDEAAAITDRLKATSTPEEADRIGRENAERLKHLIERIKALAPNEPPK